MPAELTVDRKVVFPLEDLIGSFRTFGSHGPVYKILAVADTPSDQDGSFLIRVVESGEELQYPLASILEDPVAS
ncbi:MAG: DUF5397 domain-containing protein [Alphaproteobacteria bacterium]|nr:DUF5397 domain-containing protein [Alphaproteobacteria bacterium]